jgi:hypothetical protein
VLCTLQEFLHSLLLMQLLLLPFEQNCIINSF